MNFSHWLIASFVVLILVGVFGHQSDLPSEPQWSTPLNTIVEEQVLDDSSVMQQGDLSNASVTEPRPTSSTAKDISNSSLEKRVATNSKPAPKIPSESLSGTNAVTLKPISDENEGVGSIQKLKVQRGSRVKMSWSVPNAERCSVHVYRNLIHDQSYDNWGETISVTDTRETDPINHDQKYRLICITSDSNLLATTLELKVLPATQAPTCNITVNPTTAEEGQIVTYTIYATDVAKLGIGEMPPRPLDWRITFPWKHSLKASVNSATQTFTVSNEVGSAKCSATITIVPQKNDVDIVLIVDKIPKSFVWSDANPNIHISYTITPSLSSANPSDYSKCMSMRNIDNVQVTEEDCIPIGRWGYFEFLDDLNLAPDTINHKDFWVSSSSKKLKVHLRIIRGVYGVDGSNITSSLVEGDTGYFTVSF